MSNNIVAIAIASVGVLGTLAGAAVTQLLSMRARRDDFALQRRQRQEDFKLSCYIAMSTSSRSCRLELMNYLDKLNQQMADDAARNVMEDARRQRGNRRSPGHSGRITLDTRLIVDDKLWVLRGSAAVGMTVAQIVRDAAIPAGGHYGGPVPGRGRGNAVGLTPRRNRVRTSRMGHRRGRTAGRRVSWKHPLLLLVTSGKTRLTPASKPVTHRRRNVSRQIRTTAVRYTFQALVRFVQGDA